MFMFDTAGIKEMMNKLQQAADDAPTMCGMAVEAIAADAVNKLQAASPFDPAANNMTPPGEEGHLRESFQAGGVSEGIVSTADVTTSEPIKYGYVTGGTSGPILPVEKKGLWWPALAHPVHAVSGQAANPFQEQAIAAVESDMPETIKPIIEAWIGTI